MSNLHEWIQQESVSIIYIYLSNSFWIKSNLSVREVFSFANCWFNSFMFCTCSLCFSVNSDPRDSVLFFTLRLYGIVSAWFKRRQTILTCTFQLFCYCFPIPLLGQVLFYNRIKLFLLQFAWILTEHSFNIKRIFIDRLEVWLDYDV